MRHWMWGKAVKFRRNLGRWWTKRAAVVEDKKPSREKHLTREISWDDKKKGWHRLGKRKEYPRRCLLTHMGGSRLCNPEKGNGTGNGEPSWLMFVMLVRSKEVQPSGHSSYLSLWRTRKRFVDSGEKIRSKRNDTGRHRVPSESIGWLSAGKVERRGSTDLLRSRQHS